MYKNITKVLALIMLSTTLLLAQPLPYNWPSVNNWSGGKFDVPTWFAPDMKVSGYEILRFHEGYYDSNSVGHWSYVFALVVNETQEIDTSFLIDETQRYFLGLGRVLGDKKDMNLKADAISVIPTSSSYKSSYTGQVQNFQLNAFDSWESAQTIKLNTRIYTYLCQDKHHRAIVYAISPQKFAHPIWDQLTAEANAFSCP